MHYSCRARSIAKAFHVNSHAWGLAVDWSKPALQVAPSAWIFRRIPNSFSLLQRFEYMVFPNVFLQHEEAHHAENVKICGQIQTKYTRPSEACSFPWSHPAGYLTFPASAVCYCPVVPCPFCTAETQTVKQHLTIHFVSSIQLQQATEAQAVVILR